MSRYTPSPVEQFVMEIHLPISAERLEAYRPEKGTDMEMVTNYFWNVCLCEALYPTLNAAEIALRNTIHSTLSDRYQSEYWFDVPRLLESRQYDQVNDAKEALGRRQRSLTAGRIVAELNFGFWVGVLNRPYESRIWSQDKYAPIQTAFPHTTRKTRRLRLIRDRFLGTNRLRNRVFHYEPVWHYDDLLDRHLRILDTISWISPAKRDSIALIDRFPDVLRYGRTRVEQEIRNYVEMSGS